LIFSRLEEVFEEEGDGQRADAAGRGSDEGSPAEERGEVEITLDHWGFWEARPSLRYASGFTLKVGPQRDQSRKTNADDGSTLFNHASSDEMRSPHTADDDVRRGQPTGELGRWGLRVGNGYLGFQFL